MSRLLPLLAVLFLAMPMMQSARAGEVPRPHVTIANPGTQCVAPPQEMRRSHMEMLQHQRDKTMRQGIRTKKHSLNECIACHAGQKTGTVLGKDGFCQGCHEYAAVKLDCWDCHQPKPGQKTASGAKP